MLYLTLFLTALVSATLLPSSSEVLMTTMITQGQVNLFWLWCVATLGNVLGSCINYWLGTQVVRFQDKKWFPVSEQALTKAKQNFDKYGVYSLLLAWVPIIGDPLTVVGGIFRVRFVIFLALVTFSKGARYVAVLAFAVGLDRVI
ncbi:DedA family protein [Pseudoalteromonas sp. MMG010]|uniref:YqaA family protein n=1 Tax=Pseudoalteromonas sp. MMG010 TaxID=2822685 RepID=UPI001B3A038F|nr:YqaA family protein [Pseudoalteromonas sp. MMG010]MBQ4834080.1 DedA family protein [Pseudoalteromonas sp. MMG010]